MGAGIGAAQTSTCVALVASYSLFAPENHSQEQQSMNAIRRTVLQTVEAAMCPKFYTQKVCARLMYAVPLEYACVRMCCAISAVPMVRAHMLYTTGNSKAHTTHVCMCAHNTQHTTHNTKQTTHNTQHTRSLCVVYNVLSIMCHVLLIIHHVYTPNPLPHRY